MSTQATDGLGGAYSYTSDVRVRLASVVALRATHPANLLAFIATGRRENGRTMSNEMAAARFLDESSVRRGLAAILLGPDGQG